MMHFGRFPQWVIDEANKRIETGNPMMRYTDWITSDAATAEHLKDCRTRAEQIAADFKAWQEKVRAES